MSSPIPHDLTPEEAAGMTVNERLWVSGLMQQYDRAVQRRDILEMNEICSKVFLDQPTIDAIIAVEFGKK